jgi:predicted dehydrogenase
LEADDNTWLLQRRHRRPERLDHRAVMADFLADRAIPTAPFLLQDLADRAFVESILTGRPAAPGFDAALAAHEVIDAAYRSAATRQPVDLARPDMSVS